MVGCRHNVKSDSREQREQLRKYIDKHRTEVYDILARAEKTLDHLGACRTMKSGEVYRSNGNYSVEQYMVWREMRTTTWCELAKVLTIATDLPPMTALNERSREELESVAHGWVHRVEELMKQQYRWFPCKPWDDAR